MERVIKYSIIAFLVAFTAGCNKYNTESTAKQGVLDLRYNDHKSDLLALTGEWEFYWEQFIDPAAKETASNAMIVVVPSYWTEYHDINPDIRPLGFGSYRLRILFPSDYPDTLCLKSIVFDSAFDLFLNGKYAGGNGITGRKESDAKAEYQPFLYSFVCESDTLDIVIHVSNFHHRRGGFWKALVIGRKSVVERSEERKKAVNYAILGILFGTFLLLIVIYSIEKNHISQVFFALSSLGMLFRSLFSDSYPAFTFISIPWIWTIRLEYIGTYIAYTFGILYLNSIFPTRYGNRISSINTILFALILIPVLFLKATVFTYSILILEVLAPCLLFYYIIISFKGMLKKKTIETIFFFTVSIFLLTVINDMLLSASKGTIYPAYLLPLGFFFLIASQVIILLLQLYSYYKERIALNSELIHINRNLESIVEKRTGELQESNEELVQSLEFKDKLFSIIAHDLKSPVAGIAQYTELIKRRPGQLNNEEIIENLYQLSRASVNLIDNLIHWGRKQTNSLQFNPADHKFSEITDDIIELFSIQYQEKGLTISRKIPENMVVYCDEDLIRIAIRNVLSNACKFSKPDSKVLMEAGMENDLVKISVIDSGIGMSESQIQEIFEGRISSTRGTNGESGTGLGMQVTLELIRINKGSLSIKSEPGRGTTIEFTLPGKP